MSVSSTHYEDANRSLAMHVHIFEALIKPRQVKVPEAIQNRLDSSGHMNRLAAMSSESSQNHVLQVFVTCNSRPNVICMEFCRLDEVPFL